MLRLNIGACVLLAACGRTEPYGRALADAGFLADAGAPDAGICLIALDATMTATLRMTTDDAFKLYVDGVLIDDKVRFWDVPQTYMVQVYRHPARATVIAIEANNTWNQSGLDRGVVADLRTSSGAFVGTDSRWRLSKAAPIGWQAPAFDDTAWPGAIVLGPHGIAPWGSVLGTSSASWLWSYVPSGAGTSKPVLERLWLRRSFYVRPDGTVADTPAPCP